MVLRLPQGNQYAEPAPARIAELTLRIAERANRIAQERGMAPGRELDLWLEAEAEVKRERTGIAAGLNFLSFLQDNIVVPVAGTRERER